MKYETVVQRIGEDMGPIDWSYDFRSHFNNYCCDDATREKFCAESVALLRQLEAEPGAWLATTDGGSPKCGFGEVIAVRMYDGWPWWRPVPSVMIRGPLGGEWASFNRITEIMRKPVKQEARTDVA